MSALMIVFFILLIYISYFKIVSLLFRGRQRNRYFATLLCTVFPILGSVPGLIIVSKYERRVKGIAPRINDYILRCAIIALQMVSVFMLFAPFFKSDGIYASGINVMYGLTVGGETIFRPAGFLSYLVFAPFASAVINALDVKYNIRNILSYTVSLIASLTVVLIAVFADIDASLDSTVFLWMYAIVNTIIMLLSIFSIVCVRNKFLLRFEDADAVEIPEETFADDKIVQEGTDETADSLESLISNENMYKCSRCGNMVIKGEVCSCRSTNDTLEKLLASHSDEELGNFCVYCHRRLEEGEVCNCVGEGFEITVSPEQYEGRKCQYCGQLLVGDSVCVCEKIMKKSAPASPDTEETDSHLYFKQEAKKSESKISDELAELEKKIEQQFSKVKEDLSNNNY